MKNGCDDYRIALSARMDGEQAGVDPVMLDDHLAGCEACRVWLAKAEQITRLVRVQAVQVPDLTARILAAVHADKRPVRRDRRRILQIALGLTALLQLATAIPMLLGLGDIAHTTREAASFDIALAVGFALAAWWPERARAFVPVALVLAACLTLTSAFDIAEGATMLAHEIAHVAAMAQAGLLWALSRNNVRMIPRATTS